MDTWNVRRKSQAEIDSFIQRMGYEETVALTSKLKAYVRTWDTIHPDTQAWLDRKSAW